MPLRKVDGDWRKKLAAIDFFGAFFALTGSGVLVLSLTWAGGEYAWNSAQVIASLVMGVMVSACFLLLAMERDLCPFGTDECFSF